MKSLLSSVVLIFSMVIVGTLLYYSCHYYVSSHDTSNIHDNTDKPSFHADSSIISSYIPPISSSKRDISSYSISINDKRMVIFDWPLDSDDISYMNYKSFESFLVNNMDSSTEIEIMILAYGVASFYKIEHLLSKQTFTKYQKKGYPIKIQIYSNASSLFTANNYLMEYDAMMHVYGASYYEREMIRCCDKQVATKANNAKTMPLAFWFYGRFARLYAEGGEFYDLSWYHQKKLSKVLRQYYTQSYYIASFCYNTTSYMMLPVPSSRQAQAYIDGDRMDYVCATSTVLQFTRHNRVLKCVLEEYDDLGSVLLTCLDQVMQAQRPANVRPYHESLCIKSALDRCLSSAQLENGLRSFQIISSATEDERNFLAGDGLGTLDATAPLDKQLVWIPLLWLGPVAVSGSWHEPTPGSFIHRGISNNNRMMRMYMMAHINESGALAGAEKRRSSSSSSSCVGYKVYDDYEERYKRQASLSCAPSFVIPGVMKAGTTYLFDILSKHPRVLPALRGYGFKETGCYLNSGHDEVPDEMRMNCFPYVEKDEGMMFGDGTVYYIHHHKVAKFLKMENPRMKAVIIIRNPMERTRSHHSFSYSSVLSKGVGDMNMIIDLCLAKDTRISYMHHLIQPALIDARLGLFHSSQAIDNYVTFASSLWTIDVPTLDYANSTIQAAGSMITFSIYFHHIYEWDKIFGVDNVMVIEGERLTYWRSAKKLAMKAQQQQLSDKNKVVEQRIGYTGYIMKQTQEEEVADIFRFLGVNPLETLPAIYQHRTSSDINPSHKINAASKAKLEKFYQPFNEILELYLAFRRKKLK